MIRQNEEYDHIPDYTVRLEVPDTVVFVNRGSLPSPEHEVWNGPLIPDAYHDARLVAPGWDVHYLEREWRRWLGENEIEPRYPERHFVKFCGTWCEKHGPA